MLREDRFKMLMTRAFEVRPETGSSRSCRPTTQPSRRFPRCQRALQPAAMLAVEPAVGPAIGPAIKPAVQSVVTTSKKKGKKRIGTALWQICSANHSKVLIHLDTFHLFVHFFNCICNITLIKIPEIQSCAEFQF